MGTKVTEVVAGAEWGLGKHPNTAAHLKAVEDVGELLTTGIVSNLHPWAAPGQAAKMNGWCWAHKRRGRATETERERERQPETERESEIQLVRQTRGGRGGGERERDTYFTVYPNLNDSSEGTVQSKRDRY